MLFVSNCTTVYKFACVFKHIRDEVMPFIFINSKWNFGDFDLLCEKAVMPVSVGASCMCV